jgi:hypothetical protein
MSEELRAERARLVAEISALVAECDLALQDAGVVRAYLDHDEMGVALEHLCDILIETETDITEGQCRRILEVAKALGMIKRDPQEWSQRMEALLARVR